MSDNNFEEYYQVLRKRNKVRWITVFVYFSLIILFIFIPFIFEIDESVYTSLIVVMVFGGGAILFYVLIYPYFNEVEVPQNLDGAQIEEVHGVTEVTEDSTFNEDVRLRIIYFIVSPFIIIFTVLSIYFLLRENYDQGLEYMIITLFFALVLIIFNKITITADRNAILIKLGPFKDKIDMKNVKSIEPVIVRPIRDYMGVGKRVGPDGSIGYIAYLNTGVRITRHEEKDIVVTLKQTQVLTQLVRYFKTLQNEDS
ncbi:MAG: hypothetical protein GPJ54_12270 [Candidatus Heimdallarchaeota archaeon]|nr:hypothetical protein [Candidatus Heimdallarchaeota archaeon]